MKRKYRDKIHQISTSFEIWMQFITEHKTGIDQTSQVIIILYFIS
jgi:hypothetical protein